MNNFDDIRGPVGSGGGQYMGGGAGDRMRRSMQRGRDSARSAGSKVGDYIKRNKWPIIGVSSVAVIIIVIVLAVCLSKKECKKPEYNSSGFVPGDAQKTGGFVPGDATGGLGGQQNTMQRQPSADNRVVVAVESSQIPEGLLMTPVAVGEYTAYVREMMRATQPLRNTENLVRVEDVPDDVLSQPSTRLRGSERVVTNTLTRQFTKQ